MHQGAFIQKRREAAGLTRYALAQRAGIGQSYLAQVEAGHKRITDPAKVARLAEALATTEDSIYLAAGIIAPAMVAWLCRHPRRIHTLRRELEAE